MSKIKNKISLLIFFFPLLLASQEVQTNNFINNVLKKKEFKNEINFNKAQFFFRNKNGTLP